MKTTKYFNKITENWTALIVCFTISLVLAEVYQGSLLDKRYIVIPLDIKNTGMLSPAEQFPRKIKIELHGESNSISSISKDDIAAFIDISALKAEGVYTLPVQVQLSGTALAIEPLEIAPEPSDMSLKLEKGIKKSVPIMLSLKGIPSDGYEVTESLIDPPTIEIQGPATVVEKLENMITEPLFIEARTNGFSGTVSILNENPLVSMYGNTQVQYTVKINEIIAQKTIHNIPIRFEGFDPQFKISTDQKLGSLLLEGPKKQLDAWTIPQNLLTVSGDSVTGAGEYMLPVVPVLSAGNTKIHINYFRPKTVRVTVLLNEELQKKGYMYPAQKKSVPVQNGDGT